jgi:hypothetical protein
MNKLKTYEGFIDFLKNKLKKKENDDFYINDDIYSDMCDIIQDVDILGFDITKNKSDNSVFMSIDRNSVESYDVDELYHILVRLVSYVLKESDYELSICIDFIEDKESTESRSHHESRFVNPTKPTIKDGLEYDWELINIRINNDDFHKILSYSN